MSLKINLRQARRLDDWIEEHFTELQHLGDRRSRAAGACLVAVLHHYRAIYLLLSECVPSSAFALARVIWESYLNGIWLLECASAEMIDLIIDGKRDMPKPLTMIKEIESREPYCSNRVISKTQAQHVKSLNSYIHMGALQMQRWNTDRGIEPNFSQDEMAKVMGFAGMTALLSAKGLAKMINDERRANLAEKRLKRFTVHANAAKLSV